MAQIPNLEISLAVVDAAELLRDVRGLHDSARRFYFLGLGFFIASAVLAASVAIFFAR
jgi:hypothetical protein